MRDPTPSNRPTGGLPALQAPPPAGVDWDFLPERAFAELPILQELEKRWDGPA